MFSWEELILRSIIHGFGSGNFRQTTQPLCNSVFFQKMCMVYSTPFFSHRFVEMHSKIIEILHLAVPFKLLVPLKCKIGLISLSQNWSQRKEGLGIQSSHSMVLSQPLLELVDNQLFSFCGRHLLPCSRWCWNSSPGERSKFGKIHFPLQ